MSVITAGKVPLGLQLSLPATLSPQSIHDHEVEKFVIRSRMSVHDSNTRLTDFVAVLGHETHRSALREIELLGATGAFSEAYELRFEGFRLRVNLMTYNHQYAHQPSLKGSTALDHNRALRNISKWGGMAAERLTTLLACAFVRYSQSTVYEVESEEDDDFAQVTYKDVRNQCVLTLTAELR